jgi:hypothetical protein
MNTGIYEQIHIENVWKAVNIFMRILYKKKAPREKEVRKPGRAG